MYMRLDIHIIFTHGMHKQQRMQWEPTLMFSVHSNAFGKPMTLKSTNVNSLKQHPSQRWPNLEAVWAVPCYCWPAGVKRPAIQLGLPKQWGNTVTMHTAVMVFHTGMCFFTTKNYCQDSNNDDLLFTILIDHYLVEWHVLGAEEPLRLWWNILDSCSRTMLAELVPSYGSMQR